MSKFLKSQRLFESQQYLGYLLIAMLIVMTLICFQLILAVGDSQRANNRTIFESYRWNALQFQLQSYRFEKYLNTLTHEDFPLNGAAYEQYDIVMSRIDLLRNNQVGTVFRNYTDARTIRLLNIINGEFELISLGIERIENKDEAAIQDILARLASLTPQINEFVALTHQDSNKYSNSKRQELKAWLNYIQLVSGAFLFCLLAILFISYRSIRNLKYVNERRLMLEAKLQSALVDKTDTLTMISQEARAPLNAVLGVAGSLIKGTTTERGKDLGVRLDEYGTQLLGSIEMLQDLALIDANQLVLAPKSGAVRLQLETCILNSSSQLNRKGIRSVFVVDSSMPESIVADFSRLREILLALIQNAIIYTPSGTISVILRMSATDETSRSLTNTHDATAHDANASESEKSASDGSNQSTPHMMQIAVRDTGTGLPIDIQKALRKNPLDPDVEENYSTKDMRLGLALSHKLIHLMGGHLHFSSSSRNGTEFWIDVPIHVKNSASKAIHPQLRDKHVLLVDSDKHIARATTILLTSLGMLVTHSETGGLLSDEDIDIVLLTKDQKVDNDGLDYLIELYNTQVPIVGDKRYVSERCESLLLPEELRFPYTQNQVEQNLAHILSDY